MIFEGGKTTYKLSFSFVAFLAVMLLVCDERIVLLSLGSSLVHESGHLFFMYAFGDKPKTVELSLFGMRIDKNLNSNLSYKKDIIIALGGIIFNLISAAASFAFYAVSEKQMFLMFSVVNLVVTFVNSLPVSILDLGRALKYFFLIFYDGEKSEKLLSEISYICVMIFSLITLCYCIFIGINISLIAVTLYLFFVTIIKKWS